MRHSFICMPEPLRDESTIGYLLRFANDNGFEGLKGLKLPIRYLIPAVDIRQLSIYDLSAITGHHAELLSSRLGMIYVPEYDRYSSTYEPCRLVGKDTYNLTNPRICPLCIQEKSNLSVHWDYALNVACLVHKVLLQDKCDDCGKYLSWLRRYFDRCDCGKRLAEWSVKRATRAVLDIQWLLVCHTTTERSKRNAITKKLPPDFIHLRSEKIARAVCRFVHRSLLLVDRSDEAIKINTYCLSAKEMAAGLRAISAIMSIDPKFCLAMLHLSQRSVARKPMSKPGRSKLNIDIPFTIFRERSIYDADDAFLIEEESYAS